MAKPLQWREVSAAYEETGSVKGTAKKLGRSWQTVAKHLVAHGIYPTETCASIHRLLSAGWTQAEICAELGISEKTYFAFTPYQKGSYCGVNKSANAQRIARCRERQNQAKEPISQKEESL